MPREVEATSGQVCSGQEKVQQQKQPASETSENPSAAEVPVVAGRVRETQECRDEVHNRGTRRNNFQLCRKINKK